MNVAVTGGAGFIGKAVVRQLELQGHHPVALDLPDHDILYANTLSPIKDASAVIHLAGVLGTSELWGTAERAVDVNIKGALNVLNACRDGDTAFVGITMPDCWFNVYQATKMCAQRLAKGYHLDFGVPVTHIRAFNAYGIGQKHGPRHPQKIIPTFATMAWAGEPIPIWGDGNQTVDLVHVDHIARCLVDAAVSGNSEYYGKGQVYDAGSGVEARVVDIAHRVAHAAGTEPLIHFLPMRKGEISGTRICATEPGPMGYDVTLRLAETVESYAPVKVHSTQQR